jgi:menaquinone-9 beta-reductase
VTNVGEIGVFAELKAAPGDGKRAFMRTPIVIVGAGPGGAAAAVALAQEGVRDVVLLDKDRFPRDKTCGSGLSPNGVALLDELGVGADVRRLGYFIDAARVVTPGGREMRFASEQAAIILLRKHFDNLLVERARALGVDFQQGFHARELVREGGRVVGVRARDGREIRAGFVLAADGAHSVFSSDPRPRRTISTLMGWWDGFPFEPHTVEMIFDRNVAPLYGWMFPEGGDRVNIGVCIEGEDAAGGKTQRNVRDVFERFLDDHYRSRLGSARQVGRLKGHPISYTTWIAHTHAPGVAWLGEAARITHNATGEGIWQAMQSGVFAARAVASMVRGERSEEEAMRAYTRALRRRFTAGFLLGHGVRALVRTPLLDGIAALYNNPAIRGAVTSVLGSALAGSPLTGRPVEAPRRAAPRQAPESAAAG